MEESANKAHKKVLISLRKLSEIAKDLPEAGSHHERSIERKCGAMILKFEKIIYKNSEGVEQPRWSYNARIVL